MAKKSKIVAHLPSSVELSERTTKNALRIDVNLGGSKEGSLHIAQGSVEWWPAYNDVNAHRLVWTEFVALLETMPKRRSKR
jgi:hypothetical protein